ncbi:MAG: abortive infection system antitoxin AbiGi family protein [Ferruginibacter sp.]
MNSYYSNIYWHFTGSPKNIDWTKIYSPKGILKHGKPKSDRECLTILSKIFSSKKLIASTKEKVDKHIISESFCCVTDIPIQNLGEHKKYYGNVAIGFKHSKIHRFFNPVFYISKRQLPHRFKRDEDLSQDEKISLFLKSKIRKSLFKRKSGSLSSLMNQGITVDETKIGPFLLNYFKISDFSENMDNTFYREREWRKVGDFEFEVNDIAAIIVPEKTLTRSQKIMAKYNLSNIPLLTWELLKKI